MAIDWKAVRYEFESSGATYAGLARKYKCRAETIKKRALKDGWEKTGKRRACAQEAPEPADCGAIDVIDDHRVLWNGVKKRLIKGLHNKDVKSGLDELKVAKTASEVLSSVIKGERLAWGIEAAASDGLNEQANIAAEMEQATVSEGSGKAMDGE